jgi:hypothetical protein
MFGIDLRPILSQLLGGVDLSGVPIELAIPVVLVVIALQGVKLADKSFFAGWLKPFYGAVTVVVALVIGVIYSVLIGHGLPAVLFDAAGVYTGAVAVWALWEAGTKPAKAVGLG